jgi:hypothetical protein
LFLIIVSVLGHPKGVGGGGGGGGGGVNFQFPLCRGMDVFWNDPLAGSYNPITCSCGLAPNAPILGAKVINP